MVVYTQPGTSKHNSSKAKALLILYPSYQRGDTRGLSANNIAFQSGLGLVSLQSLLPRWTRWGYVVRHAAAGDRPHYRYRLGSRGRKFIENRLSNELMRQYLQEMSAYRLARANKSATSTLGHFAGHENRISSRTPRI